MTESFDFFSREIKEKSEIFVSTKKNDMVINRYGCSKTSISTHKKIVLSFDASE